MADKIVSFDTDKYTIKINQTQCISCGTCAALAPDIFEIDAKFICGVKKNAKVDKNNLINAIKNCPVSVIKAIDKETNRKL